VEIARQPRGRDHPPPRPSASVPWSPPRGIVHKQPAYSRNPPPARSNTCRSSMSRPLTHEEEEIRQRLLIVQRVKGWSPSEMARRMGVSPQAISNWLNGRYALPLSGLRALKKAAAISADWMLFDDRRLLPPDIIRGLRKPPRKV